MKACTYCQKDPPVKNAHWQHIIYASDSMGISSTMYVVCCANCPYCNFAEVSNLIFRSMNFRAGV